MIKTFRSRAPELLCARKSVALFHPIERAQGVEPMVCRRLAQLNAAEELRDLAIPAGNCLISTTRAARDEHTIRISHCWDLCFVWRGRDAYDVDLVRAYPPANPAIAKTQDGLLPPIHPGEILRRDFVRPRLIGINQLARALQVAPAQIEALIHEQMSITKDVAMGLGLFFGSTAKLWLNLQRDYDLQVAESARLAAVEAQAT